MLLSAGEVTGVVIGEMSVKTPDRILELLKGNPELTLVDVAKAIDKSLRTVEHASAKLVSEGRLRCAGPTKGGHWELLQ